ncbi:hypothetical protein SAMD00079811_03240 [Scytonema sp. HK-05]|nr:hypothetical protein SAMD00079811_03240 [Scytonema sp. HK-05]
MKVKIRLLSAFTLSVSAFTAIPNQGNRQSIQRYLESFISLVKQIKVPLSRRRYLFDQSRTVVVLYDPVREGKLKSTPITTNIYSPQNLSSSTVSQAEFLRERVFQKPIINSKNYFD